MKLYKSAHLVTLIRLLFCMFFYVSMALVGLLSSVCSDVFLKITTIGTSKLTIVTLIGLLSCMCSHVYL